MPIEIGIWRVEQTPQAIVPSMLDAETALSNGWLTIFLLSLRICWLLGGR